MARAGITYSEVAEAAMRLHEENKTVSADNVRNLIGSGSKTTIIKHLNTWKDGHILEAQANGVPLSLLEALKGVWALIKDEANADIAAYQAEATTKIDEMQELVHRAEQHQSILKRENEALQGSLAKTEIKIDELTALLQAERTESIRLKEQNDGLERQCAHQAEEIARQHQIVKQTQHNLEHYQAESLKQKDALSLERENERNQYLQTVRALEAQINTLSQEKALLDHTLKHSEKTLGEAEGAIGQLQAACQSLMNDASEKKTAIALLEHQNQTLNQKTIKQDQELKESSEQLCNALNKISSLINKQELIEITLKKTEDKAQALMDEKLFWIQEKSQMIEHLKLYQSSNE
jgi:chromosome segregation ATPase